jgi:hypothetical protein
MQIGQSAVEQEETIRDGLDFVNKQDVTAGETPAKDNWAYEIKGPDGYVIFFQAGSQFSPEFRDSNGDPLDDSTRVMLQKCDRQGNPMSDYLINELLGRFRYDKMRTDPDYQRKLQKDLMLDEREIAKIFVEIPSNGNDFAASQSNLLIGDDTSDFGVPVEIVNHDDLSAQESEVVKAASQRGGN